MCAKPCSVSSAPCRSSSSCSGAGSTPATAPRESGACGSSATRSPAPTRTNWPAVWTISFFGVELGAAAFVVGVLVAVLLGGCRPRAEYLPGDRAIYQVRRGEAAPIDGFLLSPSFLATLYELLETGGSGGLEGGGRDLDEALRSGRKEGGEAGEEAGREEEAGDEEDGREEEAPLLDQPGVRGST